jgi:hypothetical protein
MLQGKQQGQVGIASESRGVGALGDRAMPGDKPVVGVVELLAGGLNLVFGAGLDLRAQTAPQSVAQADHAPDAVDGVDKHPRMRADARQFSQRQVHFRVSTLLVLHTYHLPSISLVMRVFLQRQVHRADAGDDRNE